MTSENNVSSPLALRVRAVIKESGKFAQVVVSNEVFKQVAGVRPVLAYTTSRNSDGNGVRIFDIGGVKLYTRRDKEASKTYFVMHTEDAKKCLLTLEQERANEPVLEFSI